LPLAGKGRRPLLIPQDAGGRSAYTRTWFLRQPPAQLARFAGAAEEASHSDDRHRRSDAARREALRPELIGRIGEIVVFDPLTRSDLRAIIDKLLERLGARLAPQRTDEN